MGDLTLIIIKIGTSVSYHYGFKMVDFHKFYTQFLMY